MPLAKGGGGAACQAEATHLQGRRPCSTPRALEASFALPRNTHYHSSLLGIEVPEIGHFYSTYPPLNQQLTWQRRKDGGVQMRGSGVKVEREEALMRFAWTGGVPWRALEEGL